MGCGRYNTTARIADLLGWYELYLSRAMYLLAVLRRVFHRRIRRIQRNRLKRNDTTAEPTWYQTKDCSRQWWCPVVVNPVSWHETRRTICCVVRRFPRTLCYSRRVRHRTSKKTSKIQYATLRCIWNFRRADRSLNHHHWCIAVLENIKTKPKNI